MRRLIASAGYAPAWANTTTDTPRAGVIASALAYECGWLPGKASTMIGTDLTIQRLSSDCKAGRPGLQGAGR